MSPPPFLPLTTLPGGVPVAHPVTSHPHVDVPLALLALGTALLVVVLAAALPGAGAPPTPRPAPAGAAQQTASWWGALSGAQRAVRAVALTALLVSVLAGRVGMDDQLENLAPALLVGAGWPLLALGCLLLGSLWRWTDPWDTLARLLGGEDTSRPSTHVWPALAPALAWMWFLHAYPSPLDPRALGLAVAAYTVLTVTACLVVGRVRWLSMGEPVGLLLSWIGLVPQRRLPDWGPPRGAGPLLAVVVSGTLFGALRRTEPWSRLPSAEHPLVWSTAGLLVAATVAGGLLVLLGRVGSPAARAAVVHALVPIVVGVVLAVGLDRNRLFTSVQLLPGLLGDPLGRGWDLFGPATAGLDPAPLGSAGLVALQLGVVVGAHLLAAVVAPRRLVGDERLPVIILLAGSAGLAVTAVGLH